MPNIRFCRNSRKLDFLGPIWMSISIFTLTSFVSLVFAFAQSRVSIFHSEQWQKNDSAIALPIAYLIAIWTTGGLSLLTVLFGLWRNCITEKKSDDFSSSMVSANAPACCFFCLTLFINTKVCKINA